MYALTFNKTVWEFPVGPESLEVAYPARTNVVPTFSGGYLDHFGPGIGTISMSASTGWGIGAKKARPNGKAAIKTLISLHKQYLIDAARASDPRSVPMIFTDTNQNRVFLVVPDPSGLRISEQKGSPLVARFSLSLTVLKDMSGGATDSLIIGKLFDDPGAIPGASVYSETAGSYLESIIAINPRGQRYEVQEGDTMQSIALQFGIPLRVLMDRNGIRQAGRVQPGLVLDIP